MKKVTMLLSIVICMAAVCCLCILNGFSGDNSEKDIPSETDPGESSGDVYVVIQARNEIFRAVLHNNETAEALQSMLPLNIVMNELNSNEKYYYLQEKLPVNSEKIGSIRAGDLMLYNSDCLVLFYEDYTTSYSYTRLGYIEDVSGLKEALGKGNVRVLFSIEN